MEVDHNTVVKEKAANGLMQLETTATNNTPIETKSWCSASLPLNTT